ncbi:unnamed protein product [Nippostrongylus brasiliensis]|uniref:Sulfatase domain-containing protein n=1 Tax=Nippostrongylus brasiliensis TaxID=27835 RepID=A0A0N4XF48_NIPBR|nr:unnamed protein product [Nippostrongylus brasiliensis]
MYHQAKEDNARKERGINVTDWLSISEIDVPVTKDQKSFSVFDTCPLIIFNHLDKELLPFYHPEYNPKKNCKVYSPITEVIAGQVRVRENNTDFKCKARKKSSGFKHDVYIIIIDSASSLMMKRSFPRTLEYLKSSMGAVQMEFLNKVGDNSRPNGFPLTFGRSIEGGSRDLVGLPPLIPDWNNDEICAKVIDDYPYHMFQYSKMGYKTMIAQDYDIGMVFYPKCVGFNRSEADHIWIPFDNRRKHSDNFKKSLKDSCSERHLEMLEYLEKFMNAYPGTPKIAQIWPTTLAHETLKDLYHADVHFLEFFKKNRAVIDRSFVFFMGDHGPRREGIGELKLGQYENLNPFLMALIPSQYRNGSIYGELKNKRHKLMTNFDIHATLMDILQACEYSDFLFVSIFQPSSGFTDDSYLEMEPLSKGSSLLREWRGPRNCRTLPIPSLYCICQYDWTTLRDESTHEALGVFFANELNSRLYEAGLSSKCQNQTFKSVSSIKQLVDNADILYHVVVYLRPSNGLFSGYVRSTGSGLVMSSGIARLNRYGRQGDCLPEHPLRQICHCVGTNEP